MEAATVPAEPTPQEQQHAILAALTLAAMSPELPDAPKLRYVEVLLAPVGISAQAARAAATLALGAGFVSLRPGPASSPLVRTAPARRAAYLFNAARRIDRGYRDSEAMTRAADALEETGDEEQAARLRERAGVAPEEAERRYLAQHLAAERARAEAAARVDEAAAEHGPLLGWRARMDDATTPACRAANGHNFRADRPPALPRLEEGERIVGYPGTPHGGACRCVPGPPWPDAPMLT